jgi:uncharacterized protein (TIGR03437 family)
VYLNPLGVVSAANYAPITNPVAPGEIITLFGSGLAPRRHERAEPAVTDDTERRAGDD